MGPQIRIEDLVAYCIRASVAAIPEPYPDRNTTRNTTTNTTHLPAADIEGYLTTLMADNGFWDVTNATLDDISSKIANAYGFTVAEAAN